MKTPRSNREETDHTAFSYQTYTAETEIILATLTKLIYHTTLISEYMGFEEFDKKPAQGMTHDSKPKVSIRKTNSIGINKVALQEFIDNETHVTLHFDPNENLLGIKPVESIDEHPNAYTISRTENTGGGTVTPTSFLRHYDLIHESTIHYRAEWDNDQNMIIVDTSVKINKYGSREIPTNTNK